MLNPRCRRSTCHQYDHMPIRSQSADKAPVTPTSTPLTSNGTDLSRGIVFRPRKRHWQESPELERQSRPYPQLGKKIGTADRVSNVARTKNSHPYALTS